jgi:ferrochelatase
MKKTAVILFNLGGPDSPAAVRPFLFNLFNDPAIIRLPTIFRFLLAKLISSRRAKVAQAIYGLIGGRSPILENTQAQARALEQRLNNDQEWTRCFVAMSYWHPFCEETVVDVKRFAPDRIVLLPLYPQFSTTTTASSLKAWQEASQRAGLKPPITTVCCYPDQPGFIATLAALIHPAYQQASEHGKPRLLLSAHGLPEKIIASGDPYRWQCERTAQALTSALKIDNLDWVLCYQSRVGPLKWITPATDQEIVRAGVDKVPLVIAPIAFVSEHSETLVEIDMEYRQLAAQVGVPYFAYTGAVATAPDFVDGLATLVRASWDSSDAYTSLQGGRLCPMDFSGCCRNAG